MIHRVRQGSLPVAVKLAITMRWLGGGSHYDLIDIFKVKKSTFFAVKDEVIKAINRAYQFDYDIENVEQMKSIAEGFKQKSTMGVFDKCCGAIDGWAPILQRPSKREVENRHKLYSRKQYYTINVQAICDARRYFRWYSAEATGNTHDATAWGLTSLSKRLAESKVFADNGFYIVGDAAYACSNWIMTPFKGTNLDSDKDAYNFYQSQTRINIECAFGLLQSRFGILLVAPVGDLRCRTNTHV